MSDYNQDSIALYAPSGLPEVYARRLPAEFGPDYDRAAQEIQRELGLEPDGLIGARTIRAMARAQHKPGHLIAGPHIVDLSEYSSCVELKSYLDKDYGWLADTKSRNRLVVLRVGVIPYDVTNSSAQTHAVLLKRGLSTHFMIDADGTIYQCHDPLTEVCIHAGSRTNPHALGLDLNSPALRKYERLKRGQTPRDEVATRVHGRELEMLDYWQIQITALKALMAALEQWACLSRACPRDESGEPILGVYDARQKHHGWIGHYHITDHKIDPAPLSWDVVCPA